MGKVRDGFAEDGADGGAFCKGEVGGVAAGFAQGAVEQDVDGLFEWAGESCEGLGVDHVAAAVAEQVGLEIEVFERCAAFGRAAGGQEGGLEGGVARDAALWEWGFVCEEEVADEVGGEALGFRAGGLCAEGSCLVSGAGAAVDEADLVFVEEVGEHVAGAHGVMVPVKEGARLHRDALRGAVGGFDDGIALVRVVLGCAGDDPSAHAVGVGDGVAVDFAAVRFFAAAGGAWDHGLDEEEGDGAGFAWGMAVHAALGAFGAWDLAWGPAIEEVEDGADLGVDRDDFETASRDVADVGVFVEVEGARVAHGDEAGLEAGGRKDEHLRGGGDAEGFQEAFKEVLFRVGAELSLAGAQLLEEEGERVARGGGVVADAWIVDAGFIRGICGGCCARECA